MQTHSPIDEAYNDVTNDYTTAEIRRIYARAIALLANADQTTSKATLDEILKKAFAKDERLARALAHAHDLDEL